MIEQAFHDMRASNPDMRIAKNLNGGSVTEAFDAFYGRIIPVKLFQISRIPDERLWTYWNKVKVNPAIMDLSKNEFGLPADHAYFAISCDHGTGMVTLRNPWGIVSQDPTNGITDKGDGIFDMHFDDWKGAFAQMGIAFVSPAK